MMRNNLERGGVRFTTHGNVTRTVEVDPDDGTVTIAVFNPATGKTTEEKVSSLAAGIAKAEGDARTDER